MISRWVRVATAIATLWVLVGCESRVNESNFSKVRQGMSEPEVRQLLGSPTEVSSLDLGIVSGTSAIWRGGGDVITVQFVNGQVAVKYFERSGNWFK